MTLGQSIPPSSTERTSVVVKQLLAKLPVDGKVAIGIIVFQLRRRSFGGIFLILSALAPPPGISLVAGFLMIVPAIQIAIGFRAPLLPRFVHRRRIDVSTVRTIAEKALPWIERIERLVKPRWMPLTHPPMPTIMGLLTIGLALMVMLPLPLSNFPPALALGAFALGLLERDGIMIGIGLLLATAALAIGGFIALAVYEGLLLFIEKRLN